MTDEQIALLAAVAMVSVLRATGARYEEHSRVVTRYATVFADWLEGRVDPPDPTG